MGIRGAPRASRGHRDWVSGRNPALGKSEDEQSGNEAYVPTGTFHQLCASKDFEVARRQLVWEFVHHPRTNLSAVGHPESEKCSCRNILEISSRLSEIQPSSDLSSN